MRSGKRRLTGISAALATAASVLAIVAAAGLLVSGQFGSQAVQTPEITLDMDPSGNTYSDPGLGGDNTMTVGAIDSCLGTAGPSDNTQHNHVVHLVIRNVEDLAGWQVRLNYDSTRMKPLTVDFDPFTDSSTFSQGVSFLNMPTDQDGLHRDTNDPHVIGQQTALIGSTFAGRTIPMSPDTPRKSPPDDTSYSAPSGGVLAAITLQVLAGNAGQLLSMDMDDANPNRPGSKALIFTGSGQQTINLAEASLGDGLHAEGTLCPGTTPTPTATASPTPTPNPLDTDLDAVPNPIDNCPTVPNPDQRGVNLDATGDACDPDDFDLDGFSDRIEYFAATDPTDNCPDGPTDDAWPADVNNDTFVDVVGDMSRVSGEFGNSVPPAPARYNIAPDPPDGFIDVIGDLSRIAGLFGQSCAP